MKVVGPSLYSALLWFAFAILVVARVDGPFALYTRSSDPAWNLRVISIGARNAYGSITGNVSSPSAIPPSAFNFFINTTATPTPDAPYGQLVWGAQPPYANLFGRIDIVNVSSAIQPLFFDYNYPFQGYSTQWNFTSSKKLLLDNQSRFYARQLDLTMYHYPAVHWLFGSTNQPINATAITIWRHDP